MTNNQHVMLNGVCVVDGGNTGASEQFEKLLGSRCQTAPTLPALLPAKEICGQKLDKRRRSDNSLLGSFYRLRTSIGSGSKEAPNQINRISSSPKMLVVHVLNRYFCLSAKSGKMNFLTMAAFDFLRE
nr:unnamed protein product [Callosobruchus chinensis]